MVVTKLVKLMPTDAVELGKENCKFFPSVLLLVQLLISKPHSGIMHWVVEYFLTKGLISELTSEPHLALRSENLYSLAFICRTFLLSQSSFSLPTVWLLCFLTVCSSYNFK